MTPIDWTAPSWARSTLSNNQVIKWTKARVRVYPDSVLCLGKCQIIQKRIEDGKSKVKNFDSPILTGNHLGIDGEPIEFEVIFSLIVDPAEDPERPARSKHRV